jgi:phosphoribosylanthranilate isomerase
MVRVKICGNRRAEDALKAVEYGADAIGLLAGQRRSSPDFISSQHARHIVRQLPPFVSSVLVTDLSSPAEIVPLAEEIGVNTIQLHGETTPKEAEIVRSALPFIKLYKAIHVTGPDTASDAELYENAVDAIVLDSVNEATGQVGGTGQTHDWAISSSIVEQLSLPVILAGGLNPYNVVDAIEQVQPFGVDVNSGVKDQSGYKDFDLMKMFIDQAKGLG